MYILTWLSHPHLFPAESDKHNFMKKVNRNPSQGVSQIKFVSWGSLLPTTPSTEQWLLKCKNRKFRDVTLLKNKINFSTRKKEDHSAVGGDEDASLMGSECETAQGAWQCEFPRTTEAQGVPRKGRGRATSGVKGARVKLTNWSPAGRGWPPPLTRKAETQLSCCLAPRAARSWVLGVAGQRSGNKWWAECRNGHNYSVIPIPMASVKRLCSSSHQKMEITFPPLEFGLGLWFDLASRIQWKWQYAASRQRPQELPGNESL